MTLRVLIAARHSPTGPRPIGGVQSWSRTVGDVLVGRGMEVCYWEPGVRLEGIFDIGIAANYIDTQPVLKFCKRYLVVCHGIIEPEKPPAKHVAFTSEELREHWGVEGPIIRQPIDLEFWQPEGQKAEFLTRFSYRLGLTFLTGLAIEMGLKFIHLNNARRENARGVVRQSACVLATGRAALESMACGVPVLLCDHRRGYQGPLMDLDIPGAMTRNYSGRGGVEPTARNVGDAIAAAMAAGSLRSHVEQHHNAERIVDELLEAM